MRFLLSFFFLLTSISIAQAQGLNSAENSDLPIGASGEVVMLIKGSGTNSGNIGIGNSNPQQKLDVTGNIAATGQIMARGELQAGNSNGSCTSANAGSIRFTEATKTFEGCDGASWAHLGGGGVLGAGGNSGTYSASANVTLSAPGALTQVCMAYGEYNGGGGVNAGFVVRSYVNGTLCSHADSFEGESSSINFHANAVCVKILPAGAHNLSCVYNDYGSVALANPKTTLSYHIIAQ